jgi:hypothetical protein
MRAQMNQSEIDLEIMKALEGFLDAVLKESNPCNDNNGGAQS